MNDSKKALIVTFLVGVLIFISIGTVSLAQEEVYYDYISWAAWSPDGSEFAVGGGDNRCYAPYPDQFQVRIYDSQTLALKRQLDPSDCPFFHLTWSPDGEKFAVSRALGDMYIIDANDGTRLITSPYHPWYGLSMFWSPDSSQIATIGGDRAADLWSVISGEFTNSTVKHEDSTTWVAWSPDGTKLATSSFDKTVKIMDANNMNELHSFSFDNIPYEVIWHPTELRIAVAFIDGQILIVDINSGQTLVTFQEHKHIVSSLDWSPDGTRIASGDVSGNVYGWNVETLEVLVTFDYATMPIDHIEWHPFENKILYTSQMRRLFPQLPAIEEVPPISPLPTTCNNTILSSDTNALITAINNANATPEADDICLEGGVYTFTTHNNSSNGRNALPVITSEIRIIGNEAILQRDETAGRFRLIEVAPTGNLTLENITLQNSYVNGNANDGGAVLVYGGLLTTKNVNFFNNRSNDNGGAINIHDGTLRISGGSLSNNLATDLGGGIYAYNSLLVLNGVTVSQNSANVAGAIYSTNGGSLKITHNSLIQQNTSDWDAGAIYVSDIFDMYNTTLSENIGHNLGGALKLEGTANISNSVFMDNSARRGGAIRNEGDLRIYDTDFLNNSASINGGGIYSENYARIFISHSVFSGNSAESWGGALYNEGDLELYYTDFSLNQAEDGGAFFHNGNMTDTVYSNCFALDNSALEEGSSLYSLQAFNAQYNYWGHAAGPQPNAINDLVDTSNFFDTCYKE